MPRKTLILQADELEAWRSAAGRLGITLDALIRSATAARVDEVERDRVADMELDQYVRTEVDAAILERSAVTCGCKWCRRGAGSQMQDVKVLDLNARGTR